jgi:hypothetical protein
MAAANPQHLPVDWDAILTTTMHNYRNTLTDNVFNGRPLLQHLMSNGRIRTVNGGVSIVEPLLHTAGEAKTYGEWDVVTVTPQEGISAAQFEWRQAVATIAISGLEEAQNNGREQAINLVEAKIMQAEGGLKDLFSKMLYAATPGAKDFGSLPVYIDATGKVGGIDPAVTPGEFWKSYEKAVGAVDGAGLEAEMAKAFNLTSDSGSDRVDAVFTDEGSFSFYESTLTPQVRYTDVTKANLGFLNLMFKTVPVMWDFDCPAGTMFFINSKYIGLALHSERNFRQSPFTPNLAGSTSATGGTPAGTVAQGLDARVSYITTFGNLTMRNRRRLGKLTGVAKAP